MDMRVCFGDENAAPKKIVAVSYPKYTGKDELVCVVIWIPRLMVEEKPLGEIIALSKELSSFHPKFDYSGIIRARHQNYYCLVDLYPARNIQEKREAVFSLSAILKRSFGVKPRLYAAKTMKDIGMMIKEAGMENYRKSALSAFN